LSIYETGIKQLNVVDPAWPYLSGIYDFFISLSANGAIDVKLWKPYMTPQFIYNFLELYDSEEPSERDYLKIILHYLYAKVSSSNIKFLFYS
jgi:serine/threonine-protein phosphatase 2A regulatory subunit B'